MVPRLNEIKFGGASLPGKRYNMKMEFTIGGQVVIIEAEGTVSVRVWEAEVPPYRFAEPVSAVPVAVAAPQAVAEVVPVAAAMPSAAPEGLFVQLAELRRELAVAAKVPSYVVFADKTLREMAEVRPQSLSAMGQISGVGQAKLEKYGSQFLAVITGAAA